MIRGKRAPHCFRAFELGNGYTNDGTIMETRADYLNQLEKSVASEIANMGFASEYAELGYENPKRGILFANWNVFPKRFDDILEKLGYAVEWNDEWNVCECGKAYRTSADSYVWSPSFKEIDGQELCLECAKDEPTYQVIVGNIGNVYEGQSYKTARAKFKEYVGQSKLNVGRAAGENVTMLSNDEIEDEFIGAIAEKENADEN